ncbi:MAG TPA: hypothetical protein VFB19_16565 [Mycobacterium sp.]|nr:hypothetical protein [Mycobacterium sp.]
MNLTNLAATGAVAGALAFAAIGLGAGVANAAPVSPWLQGHGHGHGGDGDWDGPGHDGGDWHGGWRGPGWPVPVGCVSATDPSGLVTGSLCV